MIGKRTDPFSIPALSTLAALACMGAPSFSAWAQLATGKDVVNNSSFNALKKAGLPTCDANNALAPAYVAEEAKFYLCENGTWNAVLDEKNAKSPDTVTTIPLAAKSNSKTRGIIRVREMPGKGVRFEGLVSGLPPNGKHGFHVHAKGDCSAPDATSAGDHFTPVGKKHGSPGDPQSHAGDLGNITADAKGVARVEIDASRLTLNGNVPLTIDGKSLLVHAKPDDFKSQPSGAAGERIACGIIALNNDSQGGMIKK